MSAKILLVLAQRTYSLREYFQEALIDGSGVVKFVPLSVFTDER
jgi:hypothetical protein